MVITEFRAKGTGRPLQEPRYMVHPASGAHRCRMDQASVHHPGYTHSSRMLYVTGQSGYKGSAMGSNEALRNSQKHH